MATPLEPSACWGAFSVQTNGVYYSWRGSGPGEKATTIGSYNLHDKRWTLHPTSGTPPPGLWSGDCAVIGDHLYCFGGYDGSFWFNDLHMLNLKTFHWSKIFPRNALSKWPIHKSGCGLIAVDERNLGCFGGYGIGGVQSGSTFIKNPKVSNGSGWTNEFHLFDVQEGIWSSPRIRGKRPIPCSDFSLTKVDKDTAVLFGGHYYGKGLLGAYLFGSIRVIISDLYLFDLRNMVITKVDPAVGKRWPAGRAAHAVCCLNYGENHPKLLVSGGLDKESKVLKDVWILDVYGGSWTEVIPFVSVKPRHYHSITANYVRQGLTEVLVFGGCFKQNSFPIAETTTLRFVCSSSESKPPTEKWALIEMIALIPSRQPREKREKARSATHTSLSESERSPRDTLCSSQDRVRHLERRLQTAEQRARDAKQSEQITECLLEEATQRCAETEKSVVVTETNNQKLITENGRLQEELLRAAVRVQEVEELLASTLRQKEEIERELEGKTKELAAHNTEVWRIPSNQVKTLKTIGTGGWGEVLEGTVKVAVKRLHIAILSTHNLERLQRETRLLAEVRHPNLVQFIGAVFDQSPPLIVTELLDINLRQAYEQNQLGAGDRLSIFMDIARALDYLHQRYEPIIHRDVSAPNVLLQRMPDNQWKGKVSDLGSANFLKDSQTMGEGAIVYFPPEVIPQAYDPLVEPPKQTVKIDVYSYGIVLCEVCTSRFPKAEDYRDMILQVQREHPQVYVLIVECTRREPSDRPSMAEVIVRLDKMGF